MPVYIERPSAFLNPKAASRLAATADMHPLRVRGDVTSPSGLFARATKRFGTIGPMSSRNFSEI